MTRLTLVILACAALACASSSYDPSTGKISARAFGQAKAAVVVPSGPSVTVTGGPVSDGVIGGLWSVLGRLLGSAPPAPTTINVLVPTPAERDP